MKTRLGRLILSAFTAAALLTGCAAEKLPAPSAVSAVSSAEEGVSQSALSTAISGAESAAPSEVSSAAPAADTASSSEAPSSEASSSEASSSEASSSETSSSEAPSASSASSEIPVSAPEASSAPASQSQQGTSEPPAASSSASSADSPEVSAPASSSGGNDPAPEPSGSTPVERHGQLSLNGTNIVDQYGNNFQLRGMSTHGITWFPDFINENAFRTLRDDWNVNIVRMAMYVDEWDNDMCYMHNKQGCEKILEKGVDLCLKLGLYVIIDWHVLNPGDPTKYTNEAKAFFEKMTKKYAAYPNIIYEICNEPNGSVSWSGKIKPYAEQVIPVITANDPDALIIVGTPTWSQEVDKALADPLSYNNVMYAIHFYANTHTQWLRDRVKKCVNSGLPIFCSEFGTCDASGNGSNNFGETEKWLKMFDDMNISYCCWALADKNESCCVIRPGGGSGGNWGDGSLSECGKWIREWFRKH